jgi:hypothetical protein
VRSDDAAMNDAPPPPPRWLRIPPTLRAGALFLAVFALVFYLGAAASWGGGELLTSSGDVIGPSRLGVWVFLGTFAASGLGLAALWLAGRAGLLAPWGRAQRWGVPLLLAAGWTVLWFGVQLTVPGSFLDPRVVVPALGLTAESETAGRPRSGALESWLDVRLGTPDEPLAFVQVLRTRGTAWTEDDLEALQRAAASRWSSKTGMAPDSSVRAAWGYATLLAWEPGGVGPGDVEALDDAHKGALISALGHWDAADRHLSARAGAFPTGSLLPLALRWLAADRTFRTVQGAVYIDGDGHDAFERGTANLFGTEVREAGLARALAAHQALGDKATLLRLLDEGAPMLPKLEPAALSHEDRQALEALAREMSASTETGIRRRGYALERRLGL